MLNLIVPVVFFCATLPNKNTCDGFTSLIHEELPPVPTPMKCLLDGTAFATQYIVEFEKDHPKLKLEYRIVCKSTEKT
jgi:hypothetical protein